MKKIIAAAALALVLAGCAPQPEPPTHLVCPRERCIVNGTR